MKEPLIFDFSKEALENPEVEKALANLDNSYNNDPEFKKEFDADYAPYLNILGDVTDFLIQKQFSSNSQPGRSYYRAAAVLITVVALKMSLKQIKFVNFDQMFEVIHISNPEELFNLLFRNAEKKPGTEQ